MNRPHSLQSYLSLRGWHVTSPETANIAVQVDLPPSKGIEKLKAKKFLLLREPSCVQPANSSRSYTFFDDSVELGRVTLQSGRAVPWPVVFGSDTSRWIPPLQRKNRFVQVSSNKSSVIAGELYSVRREVLMAAAKTGLPLDQFGRGWDGKWSTFAKGLMVSGAKGLRWRQPLSVRGATCRVVTTHPDVRDKRGLMASYRLALVIENSSDVATEKLIEALLAGCLPIYVGPQIPESLVPSDFYIACQADSGAIVSQMENLLVTKRTQSERLFEWLNLSTNPWRVENVWEQIETRMAALL